MFEIGQRIHGFECVAKENVEEIQSTALTFVHDKTKAPVLVLACADDEKCFCTYFRTPVTDDTGVPHILEHSVLNGSKKYPLKEPFLELIKTSLYTFLNAMTYDDKTVYPVASRNDRDFHNLVDVYLDAVYNPKLTKETFMQEGWHHSPENDELKYSGVVYNEMLGATSSPDSILYEKIQENLLPDSSYGFNSGGDPEKIPNLTYEQFLDFHKTHYHPSNSKTVLYGNFDVAERLEHLARYFDCHEYREPNSPIVTQPKFTQPRSKRIKFPITPGSDVLGKSYVVSAWLLGAPANRVESLERELLNHVLTGTQAAPLRRALIESQLGEQSIQGYANHMLDNYLIVGLRGTDENKADKIRELISTTLRELTTNGFDAAAVEAAINSIEFSLREATFGGQPKGLAYALNSAEAWLYDKDPLEPLKYEDALKEVKRKLAKGGLLEGMIKTYMLDNPHRVDITMVPDEEFETRRIERLQKRLASEYATMNEEEIATLIASCKQLEVIQQTPDTPEALASIPKLPLSCINRTAETLDLKRSTTHASLLTSKQNTNGIAYIRVTFDASELPDELLPYASVFAQSLIQTGTSRKTFVEMTQDIGIHTGGIWTDFSTLPVMKKPDAVKLFLNCSCKVLTNKIDTAFDIMTAALTDANLSDEKRITEIVRMNRSGMEASLKNNGNQYAIQRVEAAHTVIGKYNETIGGLEQFRFLQKLAKEVEADPSRLCKKLEEMRATLINADALTVHVTGGDDEIAATTKNMQKLTSSLPSHKWTPVKRNIPPCPTNEGFIVPSKVQYVCRGVNFSNLDVKYSGKAKVLTKILGGDYLWNTIRVQGNAYGCMCNYSATTDFFFFCSYRDPRLDKTITTFNKVAEYLRSLTLNRDEFEKSIIGTMGKVDAPLTASNKGNVAFNRYMSGISQETIQKRREEILDCTLDEIKEFATAFDKFAKQATTCVFGGRDAIENAKDTFDTIIDVFAEQP